MKFNEATDLTDKDPITEASTFRAPGNTGTGSPTSVEFNLANLDFLIKEAIKVAPLVHKAMLGRDMQGEAKLISKLGRSLSSIGADFKKIKTMVASSDN